MSKVHVRNLILNGSKYKLSYIIVQNVNNSYRLTQDISGVENLKNVQFIYFQLCAIFRCSLFYF